MPDNSLRPTAALLETGIDPETQRARFARAVALLGGNRAAGDALGLSESTIRALRNGKRNLHDGTLERAARALIAHADACRRLERQLSPAFATNLTARQAAGPDMRGRYDRSREHFTEDARAYLMAGPQAADRR